MYKILEIKNHHEYNKWKKEEDYLSWFIVERVVEFENGHVELSLSFPEGHEVDMMKIKMIKHGIKEKDIDKLLNYHRQIYERGTTC